VCVCVVAVCRSRVKESRVCVCVVAVCRSRVKESRVCVCVCVSLLCAEVESKNHVKENMRRIHQIQKNAQQNDEEVKQPVKALWKLSRFDAVPSRVKEELQVLHVA